MEHLSIDDIIHIFFFFLTYELHYYLIMESERQSRGESGGMESERQSKGKEYDQLEGMMASQLLKDGSLTRDGK